MSDYPEKIVSDNELEELLSNPSKETIELFKRLEGDIIFLGIAGKIGPSLAHMAKRACNEAGVTKRIIGVSRFRDEAERALIESWGIETIRGDLLDRDFLESLPKVKNVFFLAGMKFGSEDNLSLTWAMNSYLPALVAENFRDSKIVAYSTGCVYPLVPVESGGSLETDKPEPVGEYAQSCLGRERMFEFGSKKYQTPVALIRLNYAVEPRYGVLVDIANKVKNDQPVDLTMGYFNVIWQGDANDMVLRSIEHAASPAWTINITGAETLLVRDVAVEFGKLFGKEVRFTGNEATTALLSNAEKAFSLFGENSVPVAKVLEWTARWMEDDKKLLGKPTHFEVRDGKY
ncbi:NAD(P)-dependent oxidoreductase [Mariniphaga sediminis]|uniref:NAD(P)-dependent oxidoreductase n=1 Tax=Mariniphaga sediminis TaxID=1628158 RepID=A0A399CYS4_9BACT|nr:NAD(P)-dependent oxidoreductase [Mariniphaga sediminis]RIH63642.1 NAD(P)-dependent oxidoreductase [Mariniphaga sediminis]